MSDSTPLPSHPADRINFGAKPVKPTPKGPAILTRLNRAYYALWLATDKALKAIVATPEGRDVLARHIWNRYALVTGRKRLASALKSGWWHIDRDWHGHRDEFVERVINVDSNHGFRIALPACVVFSPAARTAWVKKMADGQAKEHSDKLDQRRAYFIAEAKKLGLKIAA